MRSQYEEQTSLPSNLSDNEIDNTNVSPTEDVMEETITEREEDTPTHIGFGNVDGFDMDELLNNANEGMESNEDIMKDLREACVSDSSKRAYISAICMLIICYWEKHRSKLHNVWLLALDTCTEGIQCEKK